MRNLKILALALLLGTFLYAQETEIPEIVNKAFKEKYPQAKNVSLNEDIDGYKIEFEMNDNSYNALFTEEGDWVETSKTLAESALPQGIYDAINKKFPESEVGFAELIERPDGEKFFRINSYNDDAEYFLEISEKGEFLKSIKTSEY